MDLLDKEFRLLVPHFLLFFPSYLQLLCSLLLTKVLFAGFLQALADGITASGAADANYSITFVPGTLTVSYSFGACLGEAGHVDVDAVTGEHGVDDERGGPQAGIGERVEPRAHARREAPATDPAKRREQAINDGFDPFQSPWQDRSGPGRHDPGRSL